MEVKIFRVDKELELPKFETEASAGIDLRSREELMLNPGQRHAFNSGIKIQMPLGYEAQVRPRSGLAFKNGITTLNAPGTIDADYRGEIKIILINHSDQTFQVNKGDRIAQLIFKKVEKPIFVEVESENELSETERGHGAFGSTGLS